MIPDSWFINCFTLRQCCLVLSGNFDGPAEGNEVACGDMSKVQCEWKDGEDELRVKFFSLVVQPRYLYCARLLQFTK